MNLDIAANFISNRIGSSLHASVRRIRIFVVALVFAAAALISNLSVAQELNAAKVRKSIERGVSFVLSKQAADGQWRGGLDHRIPGGVTTLATLALLNAGVAPDNPKLAKAIEQIIQLPDDRLTTYVVSMRIMALTAADPKGKLYQREIKADVAWLIDNQKKTGSVSGGWSYPSGGRIADASNTQFALLGLHEGKRAGAKIPKVVWERSVKYWSRLYVPGKGQRRNGRLRAGDQAARGNYGGFCYLDGRGNATASMTCAGISSLIIASENLANSNAVTKNGEVLCCQPNSESELIEDAIAWLSRHFTVRGTFYYLYGMERAGRLSGRRFFGLHDWYREGAEALLKLQKSSGSWNGKDYSENDPVIATSFALLFLSKGKRPIAIGKFKFGVADDWNRHPLGVHYLTRELENQWDEKLNWQTIDGNNATVRDLAETPVLFISGRDQLDLTAAQKKALKDYIENGNFIFAEASQGNGCGNNVEFDRKFRRLMAELFPCTELEPLSASHPVWNSHFQVTPEANWPVYGLQACCRTSVVYCPRSLSGHWQLNRDAILDDLAKGPKAQVRYATELGVNVVSYATGRQLRDKLDLPEMSDQAVSVLTNRSLVLPKLNHSGGADDAPNAWRNVLRRASEIGLTVDLEKKIINAVPEQLFDHPFVFLHGRSGLRFKQSKRDALAKYLEGGNRGFVFADSICSSPQFNKNVDFEFEKILPGMSMKPIPADHPIWSDRFGGFNIDTVTITKPDRTAEGSFSKRTVTPQFKGIEINGRLAVVFSPYDLSCALENATVSHCEGYTRQDAMRLALNVLLYRLQSD